MLLVSDRFKFNELFEEVHTKSEVINTFLALLELLKRQYITVTQNSLFEDIDIIKNNDVEARLTEEVIDEFDGE
jgi:segregation and condensation protein A